MAQIAAAGSAGREVEWCTYQCKRTRKIDNYPNTEPAPGSCRVRTESVPVVAPALSSNPARIEPATSSNPSLRAAATQSIPARVESAPSMAQAVPSLAFERRIFFRQLKTGTGGTGTGANDAVAGCTGTCVAGEETRCTGACAAGEGTRISLIYPFTTIFANRYRYLLDGR